MDTPQDKGQGLARINYFPQAFIQKYPNDQLKTVKIQDIACPDEYSMSLTGIMLLSEIASNFWEKENRVQISRKQSSHIQSRNWLQTTY